MNPREAAAQLLGPRIDYGGDGSAVESYDAGRLSLPPSRRDPVDLAKVVADLAMGEKDAQSVEF